MRAGHVAAGAAITLERAVLVEDRLSADGVHAKLAVDAEHLEVVIEEGSGPVQQGHVGRARIHVRTYGLEPLGVLEPQQVVALDPGDLLIALGQIAQPQILVELPEPVRGGIGEVPEALLAPA